MFACTKKCHAEICKAYKVSDDQKIAWNCDGKDGDDDPDNLDNLPIKWLTGEGNYFRFQNGKQAQEVHGRKMYATRLLI